MKTCQRFGDSGCGVHCVQLQFLRALSGIRRRNQNRFLLNSPCFLMGMMFYILLIWIHVYAFAIHFMFHCGSAFEPGASGLPNYCTSICFPDVIGAFQKQKQKKLNRYTRDFTLSFLSFHLQSYGMSCRESYCRRFVSRLPVTARHASQDTAKK